MSPLQTPILTQQEIALRSGPLVQEHRCLTPARQQQALLAGQFQVIQLRPGLILHTANLHNLQQVTTQARVAANIKLAIVVEGQADISFDEQQLLLGRIAPGTNQASLVNLARPATFIRRGKRHAAERTVSISFSHEWLQESLCSVPQALASFIEQHLATCLWQPSARALAIAQQIMLDQTAQGIGKLYLESRCIELINEALLNCLKPQQPCPGAGLSLNSRILRIKHLLEQPDQPLLSLAELAEKAGMSAGNLQRHFRRSFNISIMRYQRRQRLKHALHRLQRDQISISHAAELAGYTSAANFATAVKREFGYSPGQLQTRF